MDGVKHHALAPNESIFDWQKVDEKPAWVHDIEVTRRRPGRGDFLTPRGQRGHPQSAVLILMVDADDGSCEPALDFIDGH